MGNDTRISRWIAGESESFSPESGGQVGNDRFLIRSLLVRIYQVKIQEKYRGVVYGS